MHSFFAHLIAINRGKWLNMVPLPSQFMDGLANRYQQQRNLPVYLWYTREVATMDKDQLGTNTHNVSIHNNVISRAHLIIQYVTSPLSQRRSMRRSGGRITAPVFDLVMIGLRAVSTCLSASVDS